MLYVTLASGHSKTWAQVDGYRRLGYRVCSERTVAAAAEGNDLGEENAEFDGSVVPKGPAVEAEVE